ncbi:phage tail tape measure protein [Streptomyces sp. CH6]|uniref:phage tail tape measure protein n=1 Tax=unclassified Streptomyces TaxID=2593676 RepID=UPI003CFD35AD
MALTVGELVATVGVDSDEARTGMSRARREVEQGGSRIADAADRAGREAGQELGDGLADGAAEGAGQAVEESTSRLGNLKLAAAGVGAGAGALLMSEMADALDQQKITGKLGAQLGATPAVAQRYGKVAGHLYASAVTEDFQGAADAIQATMRSGLLPPDATNAQIESISTKVSDLASTFDEELGGVTNAVSQMLRTGMARSADEAFDILTVGFQNGADKAEDLLDVFNEYSTQFRRIGLDGQTATGLLIQGLQNGARDADQVADAIGQFGELALAGGSGVEDAFKSIGLDADVMASKIGKGGKTAEGALQQTLDALRGTKNEQVKLNAATALFGDPGTVMGDALFALDPAGAAAAAGMDKAKGATDRLGAGLRDNAATQFTAFKRSLQQNLVEYLGSSVVPALTSLGAFVAEHSTEFKLFAAVLVAILVPALVLLGASALSTGYAMAAAWIAGLGPIELVIAAIVGIALLVIMYWDQIKAVTLSVWDWIWGKILWAGNAILTFFLNFTLPGLIFKHWNSIKTGATTAWNAIVGFLRKVPGLIYAAFLNFTPIGLLIKHWNSIKSTAVSKMSELVGWMRGFPGRISSAIGSLGGLLVGKGRDVVRGLWRGIQGMGGWLRSSLVSWAKSTIPGPIASALGIHSPSRVMAAEVGRWIPAGVVAGIEDGAPAVDATMRTLVSVPAPPEYAASAAATAASRAGMASAPAAPVRIVWDISGGPEEFKRWIRRTVRVDGRGSVQLAFGN